MAILVPHTQTERKGYRTRNINNSFRRDNWRCMQFHRYNFIWNKMNCSSFSLCSSSATQWLLFISLSLSAIIFLSFLFGPYFVFFPFYLLCSHSFIDVCLPLFQYLYFIRRQFHLLAAKTTHKLIAKIFQRKLFDAKSNGNDNIWREKTKEQQNTGIKKIPCCNAFRWEKKRAFFLVIIDQNLVSVKNVPSLVLKRKNREKCCYKDARTETWKVKRIKC